MSLNLEVQSITVVLTKMMRKNIHLIWIDDCKRAFQEVKDSLKTAPILVISIRGEKLVVYTNVYGTRLGTVLIQEYQVVSYAFR